MNFNTYFLAHCESDLSPLLAHGLMFKTSGGSGGGGGEGRRSWGKKEDEERREVGTFFRNFKVLIISSLPHSRTKVGEKTSKTLLFFFQARLRCLCPFLINPLPLFHQLPPSNGILKKSPPPSFYFLVVLQDRNLCPERLLDIPKSDLFKSFLAKRGLPSRGWRLAHVKLKAGCTVRVYVQYKGSRRKLRPEISELSRRRGPNPTANT